MPVRSERATPTHPVPAARDTWQEPEQPVSRTTRGFLPLAGRSRSRTRTAPVSSDQISRCPLSVAAPPAKPTTCSPGVRGGVTKSPIKPLNFACSSDDDEFAKAFDRICIMTRPGATKAP